MKKAYLEPNVINWARRDGLNGRELRSLCDSKDLEPHFGMHGIYELARAFLRDENRDVAVQHFRILNDLAPTFCPPVSTLLAKEIDRLRTGADVIPIVDPLNHTSAKYEVLRLSEGYFDSSAEDFIRKREEEIAANYPQAMLECLETIRRNLSERPKNAPKLRTFDDVMSEANYQVSDLIARVVPGVLTASEAGRIHTRIDEFPAFRSTVRANLYLSSIPILHVVTPGDDKLDDYRHVIEASYTHVFVTGDDRLAGATCRIHPNLEVLRWKSFSQKTSVAG